MIDLDDFWYIVRSQHYTKREMEIIYGNLEYVPPKQIDKLWDKAVDKWGDWQAAQHIAKKYDDDGYLRPFAGNGSEVRFEGLSVFGLIHHLHHRGHGEIEVRNSCLII